MRVVDSRAVKRTLPSILAMSLFSLFAKADTNTVAATQADTFQAPNGKTVTFTCIKHASIR